MNPLSNPWDEIFKQAGKFFTDPHEDMPLMVRWLKEDNAKTILDLGSGSGRHVVYLAKNGFFAASRNPTAGDARTEGMGYGREIGV